MDAISERAFNETTEVSNDDPSLLNVILDLSPQGWYRIRDQILIHDAVKSLLVFMNAHLALNNSNQVSFIASSPHGPSFLYPNPLKSTLDDDENLVNPEMYRQFRIVNETVVEEINRELAKIDTTSSRSLLSGAISMALTYTNRMLRLDQSITTTTASAINSTTAATANGGSAEEKASSTATMSLTSLKARILIVSPSDIDNIKYIPIMNSIFAAQKMKVSIDVAKLGFRNSSYLQQALDATNGIYLHIADPRGFIQVLCTAFFVEPSIRPYIILPTNSNVNYRASCFITGKLVDLGYVCSVCLCIMSLVPEDGKCPACHLDFDKTIISQLTKEPEVIPKKKRKLEGQPEDQK